MYRTIDTPTPVRLVLLFVIAMLVDACGSLSEPVDSELPPAPPASAPETPAVTEVAVPQIERLDPPRLPPPEPVVTVVVGANAAAQDALVAALRALAPEADVIGVDDANGEGALAASDSDAMIAVGAEAARAALQLPGIPVVVCQAFEAVDSPLRTDDAWFVSAIPAFDRQLRLWTELDPALASVGLIVGAGHDSVIAGAEAAASNAGINLVVRQSGSDRETLYLFREMLAQIDGFWLLPDSRVLSPGVLKTLFDDAAGNDVAMAIFNPSLAPLGATLTFTPNTDALAATALDTAHRLARGERATVARETTIGDLDVGVHRRESGRLNLATVGDDRDGMIIRVY